MIGKNPTVLITDDARVNREVVKQCLQGYGYLFVEAENGAEALNAIRTQNVDLIILDLIMPIVDGFTVLKELKSNPQYAAVPVIVSSSLEDNRSIRKALSLGSYDYFCKAMPRETLRLLLPLKAKNAIQSKWLFDEVSQQKRLLEQEIRAAGKYQRFLLPHDICARGMVIETLFYPYLGVGGDFFDFVTLPGNRTGMIIADVSGHGVLPAMIATILKPLFWRYISDTESPGEALRRLNRDFLTLTEEADFITAFVGVFDPQAHCLSYANAGHPPPLFWQERTGTIRPLPATGLFLGMFGIDEWSVEEQALAVSPHDRLLMLTDGLLEARSETGAYFGSLALETVLREGAYTDLKDTIATVWCRLQQHAGKQLCDDITCIAIEFTGE